MLKTCRLILVFSLFSCAPTVVQIEAPTDELSDPFTVEIVSGPTATAKGRVDFLIEVTNRSNTKICTDDESFEATYMSIYRLSDKAEGSHHSELGVGFGRTHEPPKFGTVSLAPDETVQFPASALAIQSEIFFDAHGKFSGNYKSGEKLVASTSIFFFPCSARDYGKALRSQKLIQITSAYSKPFAF
ncbi:MAG: hypothetical protein ACRBBK_05420 [Paracoccaceae bacterium]